MGTTISTLASKIACKQAYQEKKKLENLQRIARYLSAEERERFSSVGMDLYVYQKRKPRE